MDRRSYRWQVENADPKRKNPENSLDIASNKPRRKTGTVLLYSFMSKLTKGRVQTFTASNIPKLHTLEPPTRLPDYVTQTGSSQQKSSASIAKDILSVDNGDFLTRRLTLAAEKGHIIHAVRYDKNLAARMVGGTFSLASVRVMNNI